ncbi:hypothetical protein LCGC14_2517740 [marine sediment metagenome]|uniref:Uncharacterized protein n=1 Tax=marine sediment metagenome TaxID=412755 RepID=A0A0F9D8Z3_9ZZZZ
MEIELKTREQQAKFIGTCAGFIPFVESDCAGLSPGRDHFTQTVDGLMVLKKALPHHAGTLHRALKFYTILSISARGPRGSMCPRGSEMFEDLEVLDDLYMALLDIADELA